MGLGARVEIGAGVGAGVRVRRAIGIPSSSAVIGWLISAWTGVNCASLSSMGPPMVNMASRTWGE